MGITASLYIPQYAVPLTDLTRKSQPNEIQWTAECAIAFQKLKEALISSPILRRPDFSRRFILQTDASDRGVGAILSQLDDKGQDRPVAYFSRKLLPREEKYSTIEKECLAIKLSIQVFNTYHGSNIHHTNRPSFVRMARSNQGQQCEAHAMEPVSTELRVYRRISYNGNADGLSRAW